MKFESKHTRVEKGITIISILMTNIVWLIKRMFMKKAEGIREDAGGERACEKPSFSGSFIQKWYAEDFTLERWRAEMQILKELGITEMILQSVADTKNKYAVYPTEIKGYSSSKKDMILLALDAAQSMDMKVRVGIGENDDWWTKGWYDSNWLREEALANRKLISEIFEKYNSHEAFGGWYISHEFFEFFAATKAQQKNLNLFFKSICEEIRSKSSLSIMISPFYSSNKYKIGCMKVWSEIVQKVLANTGIHIVALQDSVGAGFNSMDDIGRLFYYTKQATDALEMTLYADTETFIASKQGNVPVSRQQIEAQMNAVSVYVEGFVAFSISHFQNRHLAS